MTTFHAHFSLAIPLRSNVTLEQLAEAIKPVFPVLETEAGPGPSPDSAHAWIGEGQLHLFHSKQVPRSFELNALDPMVRSLEALVAQPFVVAVTDCDLAEDAPPVINLIGGLATLLPQLSPVSTLVAAALEAASLTNDAGLRETLLMAAGNFSTTRTTQAWTVEDVLERSERELSEWDARAVLERMEGIDVTSDKETEDFREFMGTAIESLFPEADAADGQIDPPRA